MIDANLIDIFCILDEFCKFLAPELKKHLISEPGKRHRNRPRRLSDGVNNIGKVYRHNNRVVYHSIVVHMEDNYHTCL